MKTQVEQYIPRAIKVLDARFPSGRIPKVYNSYISALGAGIFQSGLKATLALYENSNANTKGDKSCLLKIILDILDETVDIAQITNSEEECRGGSLLRYVLQSNEDEARLHRKILDIAVAVKLAIRTYRLEETKGE